MDPVNVSLRAGGVVARCSMFSANASALLALADLDDGSGDEERDESWSQWVSEIETNAIASAAAGST